MNNEMTVEEDFIISKKETPKIPEPDFIGELKTDDTKTGEEIIREALMWLPRDPDSKANTRINEEKPLDMFNNDSENIIANSSGNETNNDIRNENKQQNKEEREDEGDGNDDLFGDLIKEFNDLEVAKPANKPGNVKNMMKDAEKNPLDGVLDMPENANEEENNVKVKVKDEDEMSSSEESDEEEEEEEHGGLYAFLDPKQAEEPEDDEAKFKRIKD